MLTKIRHAQFILLLSSLGLSFATGTLSAQEIQLFSETEMPTASTADASSNATSPGAGPSAQRARPMRISNDAVDQLLESQTLATPIVEVPSPEGPGSIRFALEDAQAMPPELAARFPEIRAWVGYPVLEDGTLDRRVSLRMEAGPQGLRLQVRTDQGISWIEPNTNPSDDATHRMVLKRNLTTAQTPQHACGSNFAWETERWRNFSSTRQPTASVPDSQLNTSLSAASVAVRRRDYRLAMAATGEYTAFHGGTISSGLAAVVTAVNRLNEVFETELAIHLELVANNDQIIYTDASSDPYTGDRSSRLLNENQDNLDSILGNGAYDVGHVLSNAGGGLAFIGAVCDPDFKAGGTTGLTSPVGDPFVVDFVAHELGHQFGARHTFNGTTNACGGQRDSRASWEPGSGTTIMSYAGLCGEENVQDQVDPFFHIGSIEEMLAFADSFGTCSANRNIGNQTPEITVPPTQVTIPAETPFRLTGHATDTASQTLSYSWEQFDLGASSPPDGDDGTRPLFRSYPPEATGTRTFPRRTNVLSGSSELGESLPTRSRELNFRLTVRDSARFSGVATTPYSIRVSRSAGPFRVTQPGRADTWSSSQQTVVWDVAGTDAPPVSCSAVDILLYPSPQAAPVTLIQATANDGSELVTVPGLSSTTARVEVACTGGGFFAVNPGNFTIDRPVDCSGAGSDLCLGNQRFLVRASYRTPQGVAGTGTIFPLTDDTGAFWFFDPANLEVVVKVLDGCAVNDR